MDDLPLGCLVDWLTPRSTVRVLIWLTVVVVAIVLFLELA